MDTLVLHHLDSLDVVANCTSNPLIRPARKEDAHVLEEISAECFGNFQYNLNRFNADIAFPNERVCALYRAWIKNSLSKELADEVLVYEKNGRVLGFITLQLPTAADREHGQKLGHIPLNAVDTSCHGQGIYGDLVRAALCRFREQGVEKVDIKTQLPNNAVHRAWSKVGAKLTMSWYRFHWRCI